MEIKNLITFIQVAELSSFTKAADVLGYSQSTISFQIKQLEKELDCMLFERMNHRIVLTEKGKELLVYAQKISKLNDEFLRSFSNSKEVQGHIHIVTPDSICERMITTNYSDFHKQYPKISLKFSTADTDDMFKILNSNEADIIFTLDAHVYQKDYIIAKEERVQTNFVCGKNCPLVNKKDLSIHDLLKYPFILTEKNMGYRRVLDEELAKHSISIHPILEIGRTDFIINALEESEAISFLPEFVTTKKVEKGELFYLDVKDFKIDIWKQLIYHKKKWISKHFDTFVKFLMENEFNN